MRILKLLSAMLLLNCMAICEVSSAENILPYIDSNPSFFKTDLDDLIYGIKDNIRSPLTEDEKEIFNNKNFSYEGAEISPFTVFCKERNSDSLKNLVNEYKSFGDFEDPRKWNLSDYIPMRIGFLSEIFLKKFLETDKILIPADQIQGDESKFFEDREEEIKTSLKAKGYDDVKIEKIFFLMNFLAERLDEFIQYYSDSDNSIQHYRNIISYHLLYDLK